MARVKGGYTTRQRRKRILKAAKGYFGSKHTLFKTAKEQVLRSYRYSYINRKDLKSDFRKLWIQRINAAARLEDLSYSKLMGLIHKSGIEINRKVLADLAMNNPEAFKAIVAKVK